jgi:hypothetical protein
MGDKKPLVTPEYKRALAKAYRDARLTRKTNASGPSIQTLRKEERQLAAGRNRQPLGRSLRGSADEELAKRMVGDWQSPRHAYRYSADGTWKMQPNMREGTTSGRWRIRNGFLESPPGNPARALKIRVLNDKDLPGGPSRNDVSDGKNPVILIGQDARQFRKGKHEDPLVL